MYVFISGQEVKSFNFQKASTRTYIHIYVCVLYLLFKFPLKLGAKFNFTQQN